MELLDQKTLIKKFHTFFEEYMSKEVKKAIHEEMPFLLVDFFELSEFDIELGDQLLAFPEDILKTMENTLAQMNEGEMTKKIRIRLQSLPTTEKPLIRDIRSEHLGKIILLEGLVRRKTDVRPRLIALEYLCTNPSCNKSQEKLRIPQFEDKTKIMKSCPLCKSAVELIHKDLIDSQNLVLEEIPEQLANQGDQPKRINVMLQGDLVSPFKDSKTNPGARVNVIGIVREIPLQTRTGAESVNFELLIDTNFISPSEEDYSEIVISKEEEKEIKRLAASEDIVENLVSNMAPSIYGNNRIKEAILLQLFGGISQIKGDGIKTRGDIHILLIGDPGAAKSQMLKAASKIAPKSSFVSGKSASGVGLCVSPESLLLTNPGAMQEIGSLVEKRIDEKKDLYADSIWKKDKIRDVKIQSMNEKFKMHSKYPQHLWKLPAPDFVMEVELSSGKKIELTGNTSLFTLEEGETSWKKSMELKEGMYVATPRKLIGGDNLPFTVDLIRTANPSIENTEEILENFFPKLEEKYGTLRKAARELDVSENSLYHSWRRKDRKGKIRLQTLRKIAKSLGLEEYKKEIKGLILRQGKEISIPTQLSSDFLYVTGLIAGDGDISKRTHEESYSIRLSSSEAELHKAFRDCLSQEFKLSSTISLKSKTRPEASRVSSRILAELLMELGVPLSPKSHRIRMSETLLHLPNEYLAYYLAGLYDADGSVYFNEKTRRSVIELTTCSELLAKQLLYVFLRYDIHATLRKREASKGKIRGNYERYVLEIRGHSQILAFKKQIPLRHPQKKAKLELIAKQKIKTNSNVDIIPGIATQVKEILKDHKLSLKNYGWHKNYSREGLQKLLLKLNIKDERLLELKKLAFGDIYWEKIVKMEAKTPSYSYVYDLTVENSHNFVVDGVLVHNTATVVKDDFTKGWALEAGAIVLASGGICCIDELDKMSDDDTSAMHEALEQQTISVAKANIRATLRCETTVLGAANPKMGRFDPYGDIAKQINFPPALISRFDLIFILRDVPDKKRDDMIASHILESHKDNSLSISKIPPEFLKKYIAYAKTGKPYLTKESITKIKEFYVKMRNTISEDESSNHPIPITARQLEAIVRLSEAYAKMRLDKEVKVEYAQKAIDLMMYCLEKIGIDPKTGELDIDRITTGVTSTTRNQYRSVSQIIDKLETEKAEINYEDIVEECSKIGISKMEVQKMLDKLKQEGIIFEPRKNVYKKLL